MIFTVLDERHSDEVEEKYLKEMIIMTSLSPIENKRHPRVVHVQDVHQGILKIPSFRHFVRATPNKDI